MGKNPGDSDDAKMYAVIAVKKGGTQGASAQLGIYTWECDQVTLGGREDQEGGVCLTRTRVMQRYIAPACIMRTGSNYRVSGLQQLQRENGVD